MLGMVLKFYYSYSTEAELHETTFPFCSLAIMAAGVDQSRIVR